MYTPATWRALDRAAHFLNRMHIVPRSLLEKICDSRFDVGRSSMTAAIVRAIHDR